MVAYESSKAQVSSKLSIGVWSPQGLVLFKIDDEEWTLDLRSGKGKVSKGGPGDDKPDLTLTISDDNFVKLVMGKIGPQQVCNAAHTVPLSQSTVAQPTLLLSMRSSGWSPLAGSHIYAKSE